MKIVATTLITTLITLSVLSSAFAQTLVHSDLNQTGAFVSETKLNPTNVASTFGLLGSYSVDGPVYAETLCILNVTVAGRLRDLLIVVTMNDSIYAFDADPGSCDSSSNCILWFNTVTSSTSSMAQPGTLNAWNPTTGVAYGNWALGANLSKYAAPSIVNGKVYVATQSRIDVFGLPVAPFTGRASQIGGQIQAGQ